MSFEIIPSEEISHRTDFSILCNARGYRDAVEVGTDQGVFAADFLRRFEGNWLWLVDPYAPFEEFPYDRTGDMVTAAIALREFHGRYRFVRAPSVDAARWVPRHISPEFVYVDAAHDYESVRVDLEAWWEVPSLQMLAGHDFDEAHHPDVVRAVTEFARAQGLVVRTTHETDAPASWMIYRREPKTLYRRLFTGGELANPRARG